MAPKLKLTYFPGNGGRAQPTRLALFMAGVEFEDVRLTRPEFMEKKPTLPFGQLPTLEVDGKVVTQSIPILRYAGKLSGMYPTDPWAALKCDEVIDAVGGITDMVVPTMYMPDGEEKTKARKELNDVKLPEYSAKIEKVLQASGFKYSAGDELTISDLVVYNNVAGVVSGTLDGLTMDIFKGLDKMMMIYEAVNSHPKVVEWVEAHKPPAK
eukprot:CAMPEP_0206252990 /NCGR_PEP_ID=MMETSP0047_2-20121206/22911_1 /ASSEMBLY_ACC=CAM_ASM_000192 /TAXON_ID=195065 /ORGANISM="Chroomonas mesostigmatica_cf, Strain CCMP1168" /LENGTH=210 /DNA_ID=CAMNT_0053679165 /DNA_START=28 /DNA_END=660 /DNA_ORIENTATION=-